MQNYLRKSAAKVRLGVMSRKTISNSFTEQRGKVHQDDLNGYGFMHGGRLLTLCDEVGYLAAKKHAEHDCLTRAAHNVQFLVTMKEGDSFSVQAKTLLTGTTTLWVDCTVKCGEQTVMSAVFVFIAVDKHFKAISVERIEAETNQEKHEQASMQKLFNQITAETKT
jgi:acyl-CoA hydrolase